MAVPELEQLARRHATSREVPLHGRTAQVKLLLWDALAALERHNQADASLVRDLFFGDLPQLIDSSPDHGGPEHWALAVVRENAGELLDRAERKSGLSSSRFRDRRATAFSSFSAFLAEFSPPQPAGPQDAPDPRGLADPAQPDQLAADPVGGDARGSRRGMLIEASAAHPLRTGHVDDGERFTQLLGEAVNATIIGFTNENLTSVLEAALARKRAALNDPDAFWRSLRIVFFSDKLLDSITDERPEYPDRREALRQRRLAAIYGRRSVTVFLRRIRATSWTVYESPFVPPVVGTLFELPTGRRVVHLVIRHPQRSPSEHLYLEVDETRDQYFSAVFEDIIHNSINDNKIVPIGQARGVTFHRTGTRYRHNVLRDDSGALGWLPYVLVATWRRRDGRAEPFLQLRSRVNSARELDRLTHLATHIFQDDYDDSPDGAVPVPPRAFDLEHPAPKRAAMRRVYMEAGEDLPGELVAETTSQYLHHDREHLFFLVYSREVPDDFHFPRRAEMYHVPLPELLAICENQALRKAALLLTAPVMANRIWTAATEIAALNLTLHGHADLAGRLRSLPGQRQAQRDDIASEIGKLIEQTRQPWFSAGREVDIKGLSGLHYREFFTLLLPLYGRLGVHDAAAHLARTMDNEQLAAAIRRLAELYRDEETMMAIPVEL